MLHSSEKTLSLGRLVQLGDYESAREFLIEKEIESILRSSHAEHFIWLENKLGITLRKELASWQHFVEITERRNLFVHCDGIVSHQYLANCSEHKVAFSSEPKLGERLTVTPEYYQSACDCLAEIGVKLAHVIWRKLLPNEREGADDSLNDTCYELIVKDNFVLAIELLEFATAVLKKFASERHRLTFLLNLAQAYKWKGDEHKCDELLAREDWSATGDDFRLCLAVLKEDYDQAATLMGIMGPEGIISEASYRDWPVFRKAREREEFQRSVCQSLWTSDGDGGRGNTGQPRGSTSFCARISRGSPEAPHR